MSDNLTGAEARSFLRNYIKVFKSHIDKKGSTAELINKIIVSRELYIELTSGLEVPKGHIVTFEGVPLQIDLDLIYGSIILVPKLQSVECNIYKKAKVN